MKPTTYIRDQNQISIKKKKEGIKIKSTLYIKGNKIDLITNFMFHNC